MVYIAIGVLGLALGSFVNALVWRLHEIEQRAESREQRKKNSALSSQLSALSVWKGRSMCPDCHHQLAARDLIPVFSWLFLGGKCRYCKKPISPQYPIVELLTALLFITTYAFWPLPLTGLLDYLLLSTFYLLLTAGAALALYDLKWMILPTRLIYAFNALSGLFLVLAALSSKSWDVFISGLIGAAIYSGFFYLLYQVSKGKWIGGGDVRLALGLGLILGWQKSIVGLTMAAYLGTLVIVVLLVIGKYHKRMKLPFGPFLLAGTYLAVLWGQGIVDWYKNLSGL